MKFYIIAGERSGDLHGSNLVKALNSQKTNLEFRGFGGNQMQEAGVYLVMHYDQLAFMGFEAIVNFFKIAKYMKNCKEDILKYKPSAIILVDYGGFNRRIATFAKKNKITVFYYIPPKVWAWRQGRAWQLKRDVDRMYVILPFEKEFYKKYDFEVDYVGNPVVDAIKSFNPNTTFLVDNDLSIEKKIVALLPGSRAMELKQIVPLMAEVAKKKPEFQFVVAAVDNLSDELYMPLRELNNVKFVYNSTYDLLNVANAAIVTSGTATLETALFKVPQVVVYQAGSLEYFIASSLIKVPYISLVNLIAGKEVVRELIQKAADSKSISNELNALVKDLTYRNKMLSEYDQLYKTLDIGSASENTAKLMITYLTSHT